MEEALMKVTSIAPTDQCVTAWRNGAGVTREIVRVGPELDYTWRASVARIDQSGPFSAFPGYQRSITLVDGGPLCLHFPDARDLDVDPRLKAFEFAGSPAPEAKLPDSFATVFNLIASDKLRGARLLPRPLVGAMVLFDHPHEDWLIYMLSGEAELRYDGERHWLGTAHALLLEGEQHGGRAVLDGGGEIVLVKIER